MRKIISALVLVSFLVSNVAMAELSNSIFIDTNLVPRGTEDSPLVKSIPKKFITELGTEYVLVRVDFLQYLDVEAEKSKHLQNEIIPAMKIEIAEHKLYEERLKLMLDDSYAHIDILNGHIDAQERIIADLGPTWFQKNSLWIGLIGGVLLTGGAAWGAGQLN
jgi:hypothetical protein